MVLAVFLITFFILSLDSIVYFGLYARVFNTTLDWTAVAAPSASHSVFSPWHLPVKYIYYYSLLSPWIGKRAEEKETDNFCHICSGPSFTVNCSPFVYCVCECAYHLDYDQQFQLTNGIRCIYHILTTTIRTYVRTRCANIYFFFHSPQPASSCA